MGTVSPVYGGTVLEHFRRPRNQRSLADATAAAEGTNPLCGDRVRMEVRVDNGSISEAGFTANACAICTAAASLLTERIMGLPLTDASTIGDDAAAAWIGDEIPAARMSCATLPVRTLRQALAQLRAPA